MTMAGYVERLGDGASLAIAGAVVGVAFGILAQRSRFCMRASAVEVARGEFGPRLTIWLLGFATAIIATQAAIVAGVFDPKTARQLGTTGSLSGAVVGGALFGAGMILTGGCASRLFVLAASGNLRALASAVVLATVAQATIRGSLTPARDAIAMIWPIDDGPHRNWLTAMGFGPAAGVVIGVGLLAIGVWLARRNGLRLSQALLGAGVGISVACSWIVTYGLSFLTFEPGRVTSVSFIAPLAETVAGLAAGRIIPNGFDTGLVVGVAVGALGATILASEFKIKMFANVSSALRYLTGAILMGFGGVLAVGCSIGAGVTGGSIFAVTAWLSLAAMWTAAMATSRLLDRPHASASSDSDLSVPADRSVTD
ncbi:MAG: YeeE/YedE family protein [Hyphomicrobiaceae bacterium]|nr:YeeE/YedE family protein [Hyphomicrobiaceae bacterium]